jgi:hypothetical protein
MHRIRALRVVSAAQLLFGVAGLVVALKRRRAYHLPLVHGRPEKVGRDCLLLGTALSAPFPMLVAQAIATARLQDERERPVLVVGGLGAMMVPGYLAESLVRRRLHPSGWDSVESPLVVAGIALAAAMAGLGLGPARPARQS